MKELKTLNQKINQYKDARELYDTFLKDLLEREEITDLLNKKINDFLDLSGIFLESYQRDMLFIYMQEAFINGFESARDTFVIEVENGYALYEIPHPENG